MTFRTEDDLVRRLRRSTWEEVKADERRIYEGVNFDHFTTPEAECLWNAFYHGHGWVSSDYWEELERRREQQK